MSVTIPATYDPVDLVDGAGCAPGTDILTAPLAQVVANHNFLGASFRPMIGSFMSKPGIASGAASTNHILMFPIRQNTDDPGITVSLRAVNANASAARIYAVLVGSSTTSTFGAVPGSGTAGGVAELTLSVDSAPVVSQGGILFITTLTNDVSLERAMAFWTAETGSVSDAPKTSGYRYAQAAEIAATEPVTVEFVNRLLEAPRTMFRTHAGSVFYLGDNLRTAVGSGLWKTTRTSFTLVNRSFIDLNCSVVDIQWSGFAVGPTNSQVRVELRRDGDFSPSHSFDATVTVSSLPAYGGTFSTFSATMSGVEFGFYRVDIYLKSVGGSATQLYALNGYQYK